MSLTPSTTAERHPDTLISIEEFCTWCGVSKRTFTSWCMENSAPRRLKLGRQVRIRWSDALAWADKHYVASS